LKNLIIHFNKNFMRNIFFNLAGIMIAMMAFIAGCEKGPSFREFTYPAQKASGISPSIGFPGQNVTIIGTNFDTLKGAVKVWFGGVLATTVVSCTNTQIVVQVPANAISGNVGLQVWTTKTDSIGKYTVLPLPSITSVISRGLSPTIAQTGDTVYISGVNFLTNASNVAVNFNGTTAPNITSLTSSLIKVITPAGYTAGPVRVTFNGNLTLTGASLSP
jgi:hypothetical protein